METLFTRLTEIEKGNQPAALCIVVCTRGSTPRKVGTKMIVYADKTIFGTIGGGSIETQVIDDAIAIIRTGIPDRKVYNLEADLSMQCGGEVEVYIEPIHPALELYIFGAGHIGRYVAKYAVDFGFTIVLFDERKELFNDLEIPGCQLILDDYLESIAKISFDENTYSVIVTPKHERDEAILSAIAGKPHAYIGMIGSKRKVAAVRKNLLERNILTEEQLDDVDMPIGMEFAAQTPQEIAISIIAKIIDVKNTIDSR